MAKSPDAFRTISEVADWLGIQAHVLRFWESKFTQVKPIKRAGGRRYYRPNDMLLLGGIKQLLHEDGFTIKGVQKILREEGMSHVASLSPPLDELTLSQIKENEPAAKPKPAAPVEETPQDERGVVLSFGAGNKSAETVTPPQAPVPNGESPRTEEASAAAAPPAPPQPDQTEAPAQQTPATEVSVPEHAAQSADTPPEDAAPEDTSSKDQPAAPPATAQDETPPQTAAQEAAPVQEPAQTPAPEPPVSPATREQSDTQGEDQPATPSTADAEGEEPPAKLPSFLRRPSEDDPTPEDAETAAAPQQQPASQTVSTEPPAPEPDPEPALRPRRIDIPAFIPESEIEAAPAVLNAVYRIKKLDRGTAGDIAPLLKRLSAVRDSMAEGRAAVQHPAPKD